MANNFETTFAWAAKAQKKNPQSWITAFVTVVSLDPTTNKSSYSTGELLYTADDLQFSCYGVDQGYADNFFSTHISSKNTPFYESPSNGLTITIGAPFEFNKKYQVDLIWNANQSDTVSGSSAPNFDNGSGVAFFAAEYIPNNPMVIVSLIPGRTILFTSKPDLNPHVALTPSDVATAQASA